MNNELMRYRDKRVLVCGGREYHDAACVDKWLTDLRPYLVIQGGAFGADLLALNWARSHQVNARTFAADWKKHGKSAGPKRNQQMLDEGLPDVVLAFPGGRGTADMVTRAKAAGVDVIQVRANASSPAPI
jgi:YspA, cpYpsA-related SLOG family